MLSPTISVAPSGVITVPFGNCSPVGRDADPSVRQHEQRATVLRTSRRRTCRSRSGRRTRGPCASTTMSLHAARSRAPRGRRARRARRLRAAARAGRASRRRACARRAASRVPTAGCGTSTTVSALPLGSIATTRWSCWSLKNEPAVVPARPFGKRETVEHDRRSSMRRSVMRRVTVLFGAGARSVGLTSSSAERADSGQPRHQQDRGDAASRSRRSRSARPSSPCGWREQAGDDESERRTEHADHAEQSVRRAARLGGEQLDAEACRARSRLRWRR